MACLSVCHSLLVGGDLLFEVLNVFSRPRSNLRGSFKKYVDFYHNFFSRRHITLRFGTHIWTTNSVNDLNIVPLDELNIAFDHVRIV